MIGYGSYLYQNRAVVPRTLKTDRILIIRKGASFIQVLQQLFIKGWIHPPIFLKIIPYFASETKIQAGEFQLEPGWTLPQIFHHLATGSPILHRITFPEGLRAIEVAARLEDAGLGKKSTFIELIENQNFIDTLDLGFSVSSLEGFLFPETYFFSKTDTESDLLRRMVGHFQQVYEEKFQQQAQSLGMDTYSVLILASLIEKESGRAEDRAKISRVFHNRLEQKMRLQTDPAVIYGIKNFDGDLTRKHLKAMGRYNTYLNPGLPPTPICNPGADSLKSTLYPDAGKYLFFVGRGDGSSEFSVDLAGHNRAVHRYQKKQN